ncbi:EcsC family protein [Streptomyces yangpuensis]|uniref:EcsC family protein n=1 Tax=Streptomyces yangpuensis TaxID=1648182 RepID=A0ABY5Q246_9ACTN|nr:EcsC family protein [Streptomyces yangpuensis]UUY50359.1 EcsC family protein [Streptomyces yangpuensis]
MAGSTPFRKGLFRKQGDPAETQVVTTDPETGPEAPGGSASAALAVPAAAPAASDAEPGEGPRRGPGARRLQAVRNGVRKGGEGVRGAALYVTDRIIENAPRVPVRDLATLRAQFPGLGPDQLADKLISGACAASATVGASIGAAAMLPVPPAMPAELAAEITGVAAIELKLIAELHEVYGRRPHGNLKERTFAYLTAWTEERGVDLTKPTTLNAALGGQMKRELRQQILKRMIRSLPNLMPFMVGAAVGAVMNRRDTRKLAEKVRGDLRRQAVAWEALRSLPPLERPLEPLPEATRAALEGPEYFTRD